MSSNYVLALDPSMSAFGYCFFKDGILKEVGTSKPERLKDKTLDRINIAQQHFERLYEVIIASDFTNQDKLTLVSETPYGSQSYSAAISVGLVCGIIGSLTNMWGCEVVHFLPRRVKKFITGDDKASKEQIITEMYKLYPQANWKINKQGIPLKLEEHKADSLAVYHYYVKNYIK